MTPHDPADPFTRGTARCGVAALAAVMVLILTFGPAAPAVAQPASGAPLAERRNTLDFCPMSPLFKIYAIHYGRRITPGSELIVGPCYANIHHKDIGHTNAPGFIAGYRRYFWRSLHADYQLMPQWDRYHESNERKTYPTGFDLWNEFRLGYIWDFQVGSVPALINVQWPFGFILYSDDSAKPQSFKDDAEDHRFFDFPPMFFLGVRF